MSRLGLGGGRRFPPHGLLKLSGRGVSRDGHGAAAGPETEVAGARPSGTRVPERRRTQPGPGRETRGAHPARSGESNGVPGAWALEVGPAGETAGADGTGPEDEDGDGMPIATARELITAGVHFGHQTSRWNPKMARYIWGKRNKLHVIDIRETLKGMIEAVYFLRAAASGGGRFLFIGTKRQAKDIIRREGTRSGMPFVAERWLGGTLTNLVAIRSQVKRIDELERIESSGEINAYNKKMVSAHNREKRKLLRNLEGIRGLDRLPTAVVVVDPQKETIAVAEAFKLRIPIIAVIDTDCDPDPIDIPIPANDDAMRAVDAVLVVLGKAVIEGRLAGGLPIPKEAMTAPETVPEEEAAESDAEAPPAEASA